MRSIVWAVVMLGAPLAGCTEEDCGACLGLGVELYVRDAETMMAIEGVTITDEGMTWDCDVQGDHAYCSFGGEGTHEVVVAAPGYQSQMLSFTIGSAYEAEGCGCREGGESHDVALVPE